MKKSRLICALCACVLTLITTTSQATLSYVLGGQAVYDSDADLTWLANANAVVGSIYDTSVPGSGLITWSDANAWAAGLDINGVKGWRLPANDTCAGSNCTSSEMGNLFYNVLGGEAGSSITAKHNSNYDLFSSVQSDHYWTSTEYPPNTLNAWDFDFGLGFQGSSSKGVTDVAWAVQSGNVGTVPVPAAIWLFATGLLGLIGIASKKKVA